MAYRPPSVSVPPGYRFNPTNEQLVEFYLLPKNNGIQLPCDRIQDFDLYGDMEPWQIWDLHSSSISEGEDLFLFTQLKRLRPNGSNFMRSVSTGTWFNHSSSSHELNSKGGAIVRWKMTRFHYKPKRAASEKYNTAWLMEEFSLESPAAKHVLCRLRKKANKNNTEQARCLTKSTKKGKTEGEEEKKRESVEQVDASLEAVSGKEKSTREEAIRDDAQDACTDFSRLPWDSQYLDSAEFLQFYPP